MVNRDKVIKGLTCCSNHTPGFGCSECPYECDDMDQCIEAVTYDALELLKEQEQTIKYMYDLLDDICKKYREETEGDGVCGLCQYDGAYIGQSGNWMNECPGFETNECFCMKNEIRKKCGQSLVND